MQGRHSHALHCYRRMRQLADGRGGVAGEGGEEGTMMEEEESGDYLGAADFNNMGVAHW